MEEQELTRSYDDLFSRVFKQKYFPYLFFFSTIGSMRLIVLNCGSRLNQCVQRQRCGWSLKTPKWRTIEKIRSGSVFVPGPLCSLRKCFAALFLHIILLLLSADNTSALIYLLLLSWFNTIHPSLSDPSPSSNTPTLSPLLRFHPCFNRS